MTLRIVGIMAIAFLFSACTSVQHIPLSKEVAVQLENKSIAPTHYEKTDFVAFTAGKAAFALIGAAAMISAGNEIVRENNIDDPAIAIREGLMDRLEKQFIVLPVANESTVGEIDDIEALVSSAPKTDYLLDVRTMGWAFNYYPSNWTHYRVSYQARFRLIDVNAKKAVAETMCSTVKGNDANPPTKDQLLASNAALLKDYLAQAAETCTNLIATELLGLN